MSTGYYLLDHPNPNAPNRGDGRYWGYRSRNGALRVVVLHTPETGLDLDPPDTSAEAVARYFAHTDRPASAHENVDSDSHVPLLPDDHVAFHVRSYNTHTWGIEISSRHDQWDEVPDWWLDATLDRSAQRVARVCRDHGIPARFIDRRQVDAGEAGITYHSELDPGRRSDPGAGFPLERLIHLIRQHLDPGQPRGAVTTISYEENAVQTKRLTVHVDQHGGWKDTGFSTAEHVPVGDPAIHVPHPDDADGYPWRGAEAAWAARGDRFYVVVTGAPADSDVGVWVSAAER